MGGSKEISEAPEVSRLERSEADVTYCEISATMEEANSKVTKYSGNESTALQKQDRAVGSIPSRYSIQNSKVSEKVRGHEVIGTWSLTESKKSSTWREAEVIKRILFSNVQSLRNKRIKIFSDNKNVSRMNRI